MAEVKGWHSDSPIFKRVIEEVRPKEIIEVGSWMGASTITMASLTPADTILYCVDTWLGSLEHRLNNEIPMEDGFPTLYRKFRVNVAAYGYWSRIRPLPMPSSQAAKLFAHPNGPKPKPGLIYIDGSHDVFDVAHDLVNYWPLLNPGGIMFGDDYESWDSVRAAVDGFAQDTEIARYPEREEAFWIMRKPL